MTKEQKEIALAILEELRAQGRRKANARKAKKQEATVTVEVEAIEVIEEQIND